MLNHSQIWNAIDALAELHGLSPSGLARRAGLDSTTFNRSKRTSADGRKRWPSTESIAKALEATGASLDTFMALVNGETPPRQRLIPLLKFSQAAKTGCFDAEGRPAGTDWDEIRFPSFDDEHIYALEVSDDSLIPLYRDGDILILSPASKPRRGDRIVISTRDGRLLAGELQRQTARMLELYLFHAEAPAESFELTDIGWIARIIWASQ